MSTNLIWYELLDAKFAEIYSSKYISFQRSLKKGFNIITLILSGSGILGWKYFQNYVWIALVVILFMQLLTLIENQLIRSDKEIEELTGLRMLYVKYFAELEKLWSDYFTDRLSDQDALDKFFDLKKQKVSIIEDKVGKLDIKTFKGLLKSTEEETLSYINKFLTYE